MKKILITGGCGDLATALKNELSIDNVVFTPNRDELDVTNIDSVEDYIGDMIFDIVINAAGSLYSSLILNSDPNLWIRDVNVNLIGPYLVSRKVLINNSKTRIINISSTAAYNHYKEWTSYCASKSGLMKLSGGLVLSGFDIVTLCPGAIDTKIRIGLNIKNDNVMNIQEGINPIIAAVKGFYSSGDIVFYRKNQMEIRKDF